MVIKQAEVYLMKHRREGGRVELGMYNGMWDGNSAEETEVVKIARIKRCEWEDYEAEEGRIAWIPRWILYFSEVW